MRVTGEITSIERLNNSVNGNPRYTITVSTDGGLVELITSSDISDAYEVGNPGYRVGSEVTFDLTDAGRIRTMRPDSGQWTVCGPERHGDTLHYCVGLSTNGSGTMTHREALAEARRLNALVREAS